MNDIELVVAYHERTKHAPNRYAASLGYMDWATQPNPYRHYEGTLKTRLPLSFDNPTPPFHLLDVIDTAAPFCIDSISQFFQFSLGLAAFKRHGDQGWALRCNASSGNLQPTEAYLIAPHLTLEGYQIAHYAPEHHELELLAHFDTNFFDALPKGSFLVGVSSIAWREAWKYGERSFRYCQLDAGHALQALTVSAKMLGWNLQRFDVNMQELDKLLGFNQRERFIANEREDADMLLLVSPEIVSPPSISSLLNTLPNTFEGKVNQLSHKHHPWEVLDTINDITHSDFITS
ncbi:MAG TPA: SagB/ThcOx family dehydrogenase, partial [Helicobacteraceae bacterium]|nr:SagB/ThcOx family dehydrogenase [Helicobacteraceae bacterium]